MPCAGIAPLQVSRLVDSQTFVVRLYRSSPEGHGPVAGMVERVGSEVQQPFRSMKDLWEIINQAAGPGGPRLSAGSKRKTIRKTGETQ
jgi:hypothetical protein